MSDVSKPVVTGPTVLLRPPCDADRARWRRVVAASRDFLRPWIDATSDDDPDGDAWFDSTLDASYDERYEKLLVVLRDRQIPVGAVNFNEIVRGSFQSAYLGYWIGAQYARRGLMTEALGIALHHGFETLGLHRLEANLQPENTASRALVRRHGFTQEGFSPGYLKIGGQWRDHERWALTRERWQQVSARLLSFGLEQQQVVQEQK